MVEVPCVREGTASYDLVEGVRRVRLKVADRHQGEDSSCSEAAGDSSYYVVEAAPFVQGEGSSWLEVGHHVRVEGSSYSEAEVLVLGPVLVGCSRFGEGPARG